MLYGLCNMRNKNTDKYGLNNNCLPPHNSVIKVHCEVHCDERAWKFLRENVD